MTREPIIEAAIEYHGRGWVPARITPQGKAPADIALASIDPRDLRAVDLRRARARRVARRAERRPGRVDLDAAEARALADQILPATPCTFGRASPPASHRLYISSGVRTVRLRDPDRERPDGAVLVELRGSGSKRCSCRPSIRAAGGSRRRRRPPRGSSRARVGRHECLCYLIPRNSVRRTMASTLIDTETNSRPSRAAVAAPATVASRTSRSTPGLVVKL